MMHFDQNKVTIFLNLEGQKTEFGTLILDKSTIYFKLSNSYLNKFNPFSQDKLLVSPFKMKHNSEIQTCSLKTFDGLFGLFSDSLPDAWGKLLLDRYIVSRNISISQLNPLTRLLFVGENGNGALEYQPELENLNKEARILDLEKYNSASKLILQGENSEILSSFYRLGGTSGGARPKINIAYNKETGNCIDSFEKTPQNYESWLLKFPSIFDLPDCANIEFAYYKMATACWIEMSDSILLKGDKNNYFFATKRFDRIDNNKIHTHSLAGLLHDDFINTSLDYGHLLDVAFYLEKDVEVYQKIMKLAIFNVFACNQDDHSKNFSFLMNKKGEWKFSPAYDLTFSQGSYGFQSMSVAKNAKNIMKEDFMKLANHFHIQNVDKLIEEVKDQLSQWNLFAKDAGVSDSSIKMIKKVIDLKIK
jgi:serine/threonine-protein kinase HipA